MISDNVKNQINIFFGHHPISNEEIQRVERCLGITIPASFIEINKISSYEYSRLVGFFNFGEEGPDSVIDATLGLRKSYTNCKEYIVLYLDDAGIILMNTADVNASVIWCSVYDLDNLFNKKELSCKHRFFPTFADFYSYLLDEAEKEQAAEKVK